MTADTIHESCDLGPDNRVRVLTVDDRDDIGGTERSLLRLAPLLADRGIEQVLVTPPGAPIADAWRALGLRHQPLAMPVQRAIRVTDDRPPRAQLVARELQQTWADARGLADLADSIDAAVIHSNGHWTHLGAAIAGRLSRRATLIHLHDESLPGVARHLRALNVRLATWTIAVSDAVAHALPSWAGHRVTVIRHGVDGAEFCPGLPDPRTRALLCDDPAAPLILVAGRLDSAKGVDDVIRAVGLLPVEQRSARLAIVGPDLRSDYAGVLRTLGAQLLGDRVRFLGPVDEIAPYLRAADVVAVASRHEGLGLIVLEAQACGTPVVAYPTGGIGELIVDGRTGILVRPADPAHLARCLAQLLRDRDLSDQIARAARLESVTTRTLESEADQEAALVRSLAGGRLHAGR